MANSWNRLIGSSRDFQRRPDPRRVPPPVSRLAADVIRDVQADGTTLVGVQISWVEPTYYGGVMVDVWYQQRDGTGEWQYAGRTRRSPMMITAPDIRPGGQLNVAVATVSGNEVTIGAAGSPQVQVDLANYGTPQPPDVTGFGVTDYGSSLLFQWNPVDADAYPFVMGYEVRAGATGWSSATFVCKAGLRNTPWWPCPRPLAPGSDFYIKAVSYAEVYSATPGTASLTAADAVSVDAASPGTYYQELTIAAGAQSVTLTTKGQFSSAPYLGVAGSVSGYDGSLKGSTLSQNGDGTWSGTFYGDDIGEAGGSTITVIEAGPRQ